MKNKITIGGLIILIFIIIHLYRNYQKDAINEKLTNKKVFYVDYDNKVIHRDKSCYFMLNSTLEKEELSLYDIKMLMMNEGYQECDSCFNFKH